MLFRHARSLLAFALLVLVIVSGGCSRESRLRARCLGGEVAVCTQLGDEYMGGKDIGRNIARAVEMYEHACSGGVSDVCNTLGEIYERTELEGGMDRASQYYAKACDGHNSAGCLNLGLFFLAKDQKEKAVSLFERSCSGGWAPGCHQLATSYEEGEGVTRDFAKAIAHYGEACDLEHTESCLALGNKYLTGDLGTKDPALASKFFARAVALFDMGCKAGLENDCTERDKIRTRMVAAAATATTAPLPPQPDATVIK